MRAPKTDPNKSGQTAFRHPVPHPPVGEREPLRQVWVPEGSLAGFLLGRFLGSGRPLGALKPSKKVGGEAPHLLGGFQSPQGPPRPQKPTPKNSGQTAFRYPATNPQGLVTSRAPNPINSQGFPKAFIFADTASDRWSTRGPPPDRGTLAHPIDTLAVDSTTLGT